jgi:hypothetical protein
VGSRNNIHQKSTPHLYWEDASRKDQGWALLGKSSAPPTSDEDDLAVVGTVAPMVDNGARTYKTTDK